MPPGRARPKPPVPSPVKAVSRAPDGEDVAPPRSLRARMKPSVEYGEEQDLPPKKKAKTKRKKWSTKKQLKRSAAAVKEDAAEEGSQASAVLGLASLAPLKFLAPALEEMLEKRLCSFASEEHGMVRRELGSAVEALKVGLG